MLKPSPDTRRVRAWQAEMAELVKEAMEKDTEVKQLAEDFRLSQVGDDLSHALAGGNTVLTRMCNRHSSAIARGWHPLTQRGHTHEMHACEPG